MKQAIPYDKVLSSLQKEGKAPLETLVVRVLEKESDFTDETSIRRAILYMLDDGRIRIDIDYNLCLAE